VPLVACAFVIPALFLLVALLLGSILGALEEWSTKDGILYVFGIILGLATPFLTDVNPTSMAGDLVDIIIASIALGFIAVFIDYVTILNPARYCRKRTRAFLGKLSLIDPITVTMHHPLDYQSSVILAQEYVEQHVEAPDPVNLEIGDDEQEPASEYSQH
jgi:hypothetical protein